MSNSASMSQQEIDEMLQQAMSGSAGNKAVESPLSEIEIDALGEIGNISMGAAATALYTILGRNVRITTPKVSVTTLEKLAEDHLRPYVVVDVEYTEGFLGHSLFILQIDDVKIITDIMMGGEGKISDEDLSELHISAIAEAMNQMMGGMATSMADMFSRVVNISPPHSMIVELADQEIRDLINKETPELIRISFKMEIEGLMDSSIMQLMPLRFGQQLVGGALGSNAPAVSAAPAAPVGKPALVSLAPQAAAAPPQPQYAPPAFSQPKETPIDARPIQLPSFDDPAPRQGDSTEFGIGLIMDIPLQITVELGQCRKTIKEILDLNTGSILTLDKQAGEPVDIVVHGKPVAKGEVIVIDESYGIRITEILTPAGRILPGALR